MGAADGCMTPAEPRAAAAHQLREALARVPSPVDAPARLRELIALGLDQLPMPGSGLTLERWRALAAVAEHDLSLAKLYEGHTDALAILDEMGAGSSGVAAFREPSAQGLLARPEVWGVWASEAPGGRVTVRTGAQGPANAVLLDGVKHWCSGAKTGTRALLTVWHEDSQAPQLASLAIDQPGVQVLGDAWKAVGMNESASLQVRLAGAHAQLVGQPGHYLSRPGFWQGGAGVAACWYGGAVALARALQRAVAGSTDIAANPFRLAAAGRVGVMLRSTALMLQDAARWIDTHPHSDARQVALGVRLAAAECATRVLDEVAGALGATPFCTDAAFARTAADLPVFIRQSHGDRDYAALGQQLALSGELPWAL